MNREFAELLEDVEAKCRKLLAMQPITAAAVPPNSTPIGVLRVLLALLVAGVWANALSWWIAPAPVRAQGGWSWQLIQLTTDVTALRRAVDRIESGRCSNIEIC